jgi:signal transduction histidine kinase
MRGHELRNPLAPISNALALLRLSDSDRETVRWATDIMERQVRQMVRLVDDLYDLSRIMQGKLELCKERVELAALIASAVETARPVIDAKGHELIVSLPVGPVILHAGPMRLSQVLTNLLNNAAKYSEPGGKIVLSARTDGNEVVIGVRDDGVGIAPAMLPRVFDLFMQDGRSADLSQGGLGIGLALVKSLVEIQGGVVQARSDGPGQRVPRPTAATGFAGRTVAEATPEQGQGELAFAPGVLRQSITNDFLSEVNGDFGGPLEDHPMRPRILFTLSIFQHTIPIQPIPLIMSAGAM